MAKAEEKPAKEKKEPVILVEYNGKAKRDSEGNLTEIPADFDKKVHKPLSKKLFSKDFGYLYYEWRVARAKEDVERFQQKAEEEKLYGNSKQRAARKAFVRAQQRVEHMAEELKAAGIDPAELMKQLQATS